jgi:hypothetical protein
MTWRIHLLPMTGGGTSHLDPRVPKYLAEFGAGQWQLVDYGSQDVCFVALDADAATHSALTAHADVLTVPANLDNTPGAGAVTTTRNALEALDIPGGWVTTSTPWRTVVRVVVGMFLLNQRFWVIRGNNIGNGRHSLLDGVDLDMTVADIPQAARQDLQEAALSLELDTSEVTGATTIREMLRIIGQQFAARPYVFDAAFVV